MAESLGEGVAGDGSEASSAFGNLRNVMLERAHEIRRVRRIAHAGAWDVPWHDVRTHVVTTTHTSITWSISCS